MSDLAPTPETDAMENFFVALCPAYSAAEYTNLVGLCTEQLLAKCRALERERNAARAAHNDALLRLHVTTAERDDALLRLNIATVKLASDPHPPSDSPDYVRALEIHIHLLRAELADERAKKSDALRNPAGATIADGGEWTREEAIEMHRRKADELLTVKAERDKLKAERDNLSDALERNCVQYVQKQQALIAERDSLRADLTKMAADLDYAQDEAFKGGV